jgi:hypothetical protein
MDRKKRLEQKGILLLRKSNENKEIDFELKFLSSLSLEQRFSLMLEKTQELKNNLEKNGHRTTPQIIKRR